MAAPRFFESLLARIGLQVGVLASAAFLAGCATTTQTPQICSTPGATRDPKCPPVTHSSGQTRAGNHDRGVGEYG